MIELREAKHIGAVDDQRIGGRNIEPGFDDVGAEQHVEGMLVEGGHNVFQRLNGHLAVGDADADGNDENAEVRDDPEGAEGYEGANLAEVADLGNLAEIRGWGGWNPVDGLNCLVLFFIFFGEWGGWTA